MSDPADDAARECVERLSEHFDSVIIIATTYQSEGHEDGQGTVVCVKRRGNYYATKGAVTEWLEQERDSDLAKRINECEE